MTDGAPRKALAQGLDRLNEDMRTLADLSELSIRKAVDCLETGDTTEVEEVTTLDSEIWGLQIAVERTCVDLIALHAPVALDLRTITTCLKITTDLDRIGRYARDLAEIAVKLAPRGKPAGKNVAGLSRMGDLTIHMVDTAIRAFIDRDADSVRNIQAFDDAVDNLHDEIFKEIVEALSSRSVDGETGAYYIIINRNLERIADHAVNIGKSVVYMVTGEQTPRNVPSPSSATQSPATPTTPSAAPGGGKP